MCVFSSSTTHQPMTAWRWRGNSLPRIAGWRVLSVTTQRASGTVMHWTQRAVRLVLQERTHFVSGCRADVRVPLILVQCGEQPSVPSHLREGAKPAGPRKVICPLLSAAK
jgi:hypothetical protein